jgi:hypothetical protein
MLVSSGKDNSRVVARSSRVVARSSFVRSEVKSSAADIDRVAALFDPSRRDIVEAMGACTRIIVSLSSLALLPLGCILPAVISRDSEQAGDAVAPELADMMSTPTEAASPENGVRMPKPDDVSVARAGSQPPVPGGTTPASGPNDANSPHNNGSQPGACVNDDHCPIETPACDQMTCYECRVDEHCDGAGKHFCVETEHRCVECQTHSHCAGEARRSHCFQKENVCVECLVDSDCSERSASHCDSDSHTCVACRSHADCAASAGSAPRCGPGGCVACDEEGGICNGKACILSQNVCSSKLRQSVQACGECVTSDECAAGHVCVNVGYPNGHDTGDFCLPKLPDSEPCPRPFGRMISNAATLDGFKVQTLCALPEATTCQALLDTLAMKNCNDNNAECGLGRSTLGANDGMCASNNVCTYNCTSSEFCPNNMVCSEERALCL